MKEARYYKAMPGGNVQCTACEWKCTISKESSGVCGVRSNEEGTLMSLVYGNVADAYADPIEKKKVAHVLPGSMAFSIGTIGCNFGCDFCLNWQTSQASKMIREKLTEERRAKDFGTTIAEYGYSLAPGDVIEYCKRKGYRVIAFTYNEPTVFIEYALDIAKLAKKEKFITIFVTNGYMSETVLPDIAENIDVVSFDLKAFTEKFYKKHCKASLGPVLRNIQWFAEHKTWIEITTLLIPGENDADSELRKVAAFIAGLGSQIPWHITRFSPDYKLLDKPETPEERMYRAWDIAKEEGLEYVYFGNLWDSKKTSLYCPKCGELLIFRDIYDVEVQPSFVEGTCGACGKKIPGIWT